MKYVYPAIFTEDKDLGGYCVSFPDISGCLTEGDTLQEACDMAEDALQLMLTSLEDEQEPIPCPSDMKTMKPPAGSFVTLVRADTEAYRRTMHNKAVRKSISIPEWMDHLVKENHLNLSNFVQQHLRVAFGV